MCAAVIGGMDRLKRDYMNEAKDQGFDLKHFTGKERTIGRTMGNVDLVVLFTGKVSHKARRDVLKAAKKSGTPVVMSHACGVSSLKKCLSEAA